MQESNIQENCDSSLSTATDLKIITSFGKTRAARWENNLLQTTYGTTKNKFLN